MQLRSNIALKIFALILFTVEFLAPAMVTGLTYDEAAQEKTLSVSSSGIHNPFFSVLFEELCENEEGKESDRDTNSSEAGLLLSSSYQHFFQATLVEPLGSGHIQAHFDVRPPLFLVHRKLLI
ncbi:MAG: hypothetical protein AABY93_12360 [Bacteroidota bacterium]